VLGWTDADERVVPGAAVGSLALTGSDIGVRFRDPSWSDSAYARANQTLRDHAVKKSEPTTKHGMR
jgi:hypothetical protein